MSTGSTTTNFYAPPSVIRSDRVVLPEAEARHARSVLRVQEGDEVVVVDGEGGWYRLQVSHATSERVVGTIVERRAEVGEPEMSVTVGMSILKKRSRFETFVEKAVELGVRRIVPLRTRRTERDSVRADRLENVMIAAMKQCRRSRLPTVAAPTSLKAFLEDATSTARFVCHGVDDAIPLPQAAEASAPDSSIQLLVGPEGGFAPLEIDRCEAAGCTPVALGKRRLRAETAGLVALHTVVATRTARQ